MQSGSPSDRALFASGSLWPRRRLTEQSDFFADPLPPRLHSLLRGVIARNAGTDELLFRGTPIVAAISRRTASGLPDFVSTASDLIVIKLALAGCHLCLHGVAMRRCNSVPLRIQLHSICVPRVKRASKMASSRADQRAVSVKKLIALPLIRPTRSLAGSDHVRRVNLCVAGLKKRWHAVCNTRHQVVHVASPCPMTSALGVFMNRWRSSWISC